MGFVVDKHIDCFPTGQGVAVGRHILIFCLLSPTRRPRASDKKAALFVHGRLETQKRPKQILSREIWTRGPLVSETDGHLATECLLWPIASLSRSLPPTQVLTVRLGLRRLFV